MAKNTKRKVAGMAPPLAPEITMRPISTLKANPRNARTHSKDQIRQIARSIERFGFTNPVLTDSDGGILAGHGRIQAAKLVGLTEVPTVCLAHLSREDQRSYLIADNKLALNAGWDQQILALELAELADLGYDLALTGFATVEIDSIFELAAESQADPATARDDEVPQPPDRAVTRIGDIWQVGRHRLICGDTREREVWQRLMGSDKAGIIFTDPPYNVPIDGHVSGLGQQKHREFACASGEMTSGQFREFLAATLGPIPDFSRDGAITYICMDWRHASELLDAARPIFSEYKQLVVWNKSNGGMGTFYRSKHELIFVFKAGTAPHINNFGLGDGGRYRTNVWDYAGISSMSSSRAEELAMHPTVKPVALIADALRDCSNRGDIVLDPFGGSGSTLIAAQKVGRVARLIEIDPIYCDVTVKRFEKLTGKQAVLVGDGRSFADIAEERLNNEEDA